MSGGVACRSPRGVVRYHGGVSGRRPCHGGTSGFIERFYAQE